MSVGRRAREAQREFWVAAEQLQSPGNPFYDKLNELLREAGFDLFVEELVAPFYSNVGKRGLAAGIYFRMLFVGYFEGIASDRGMAWRCADSLSLRKFLGIPFGQQTPDHSTLSKTRKRLPLEVHLEASEFVVQQLVQAGLVDGEGIAIDASLLHANASLASLVHKETGDSFREFLIRLAKESGIEAPTNDDLKNIDKKRRSKKKSSNKDWHNPNDPDAKIKKTPRDGTKMAYKVEHAVDTNSGAIVCAMVHPGDAGDTTTGPQTLEQANATLGRILDRCPEAPLPGCYVAADKGYHSGKVLIELEEAGYKPVISEKRSRGKRRWKQKDAKKQAAKDQEQAATYRNRKRRKTETGKRLRRRRAEMCERSFAHTADRGDLRNVYIRGREAVNKRWLIHTAGFNLGLLMRARFGIGTPRCLQGTAAAVWAIFALIFAIWRPLALSKWQNFGVTRPTGQMQATAVPLNAITTHPLRVTYSSTPS